MSEYHNNLSKQFLIDYSEVLPVVIDLRSQGFSMQQIANELNKSGYLTREKKPFSSVQVLRILQRARDADPTQPGAPNSTQSVTLDSQLQQQVEQLKSEIYTLKTQVEELQQELSDLKSQVFELKQEIELKKVNYSEIPNTSQVDEMRTEPARQSPKPARKVDKETRKFILQQAIEMHLEDSKLSKSAIARVLFERELSERFDVEHETVRGWFKPLW